MHAMIARWRILSAAVLIALIGSASVADSSFAQDRPAHPRSYYPVLRPSDLEQCRGQLTEVTDDYVVHLLAERADYLPGGISAPGGRNAYNYRAGAVAEYDREIAKVRALGPIAWYAKGIGEEDGNFPGLESINAYPENTNKYYDNFLKGLDGQGRPLRLWNHQDRRQLAVTQDVFSRAETCIAKVWQAKFDVLHPVHRAPAPIVAAKPPAPRQIAPRAAPAGDSAVKDLQGMAQGLSESMASNAPPHAPAAAPTRAPDASAAVAPLPALSDAECRKRMTDFKREVESSGVSDAVAALRLGQYQMQLLQGQCAGMAMARMYIAVAQANIQAGQRGIAGAAGASQPAANPPAGVGSYADGGGYARGGVSVSGPDQTGVSTVASPKITGAPTPIGSGKAGGSSNLYSPGPNADKPGSADGCIKISRVQIRRDKTAGQALLTNVCTYPVWVWFPGSKQNAEITYRDTISTGTQKDPTVFSASPDMHAPNPYGH
ncbi:hypothetical protein BH09PSE4_BH09PSE4_22990 [soil metagenome]